mmetsp:Transcript_20399/g.44578  ORF Transcript_20399/g.44578 Transcript_20399/m.44578 type:complete len:245 (+) Transcript_20399:4715-5449(+)
MTIGYELRRELVFVLRSRSHSETQERKKDLASSLVNNSSPLRRSPRPSSCCPQSGPRTSPILFMRASTCLSICFAQSIFPLTGGIPRRPDILDAGEESYFWVNFPWSLSMAWPTVDMSSIWNSFTAERTRVLVRSGLNLAKTRNMSSASCAEVSLSRRSFASFSSTASTFRSYFSRADWKAILPRGLRSKISTPANTDAGASSTSRIAILPACASSVEDEMPISRSLLSSPVSTSVTTDWSFLC